MTTAVYNPAEIERLIVNGRYHATERSADINWMRKTILAMADQLEAARDAALEVASRAPTFPAAFTETKDRDSVAALESEVEQLRTLVQTIKFHTEENAQLCRVCVDQAEQIADLRAEWAPCMTPDDVTARASRIAEAGKRLVMSHVGKVKELRAQLALETAALELACAADVYTQVTVAEARQLAASADSIREAFETGFACGLERGHDTTQVRAEVTTHKMVREDLALRERALKEHMTGLAERVGRR